MNTQTQTQAPTLITLRENVESLFDDTGDYGDGLNLTASAVKFLGMLQAAVEREYPAAKVQTILTGARAPLSAQQRFDVAWPSVGRDEDGASLLGYERVMETLQTLSADLWERMGDWLVFEDETNA